MNYYNEYGYNMMDTRKQCSVKEIYIDDVNYSQKKFSWYTYILNIMCNVYSTCFW